MTADGRIDMMDIMGMFAGGDLDLAPPKSVGRIVTGFNGMIFGLESISTRLLEDRTVYDIQSRNGTLTLVKQGKSYIDFNTEKRDISTILLMESSKLILTETEKDRLELEEEIASNGFLKTRDKYLIQADEKVEGAEAKVKVLYIMYPPSKCPDKWV